MDNIARNKWQVRVAAVLIFLLGFVAGCLALNLYHAWAGRRAAREDRFEQLSNSLQLSADQKTKVQQILADTREQLRSLRQQSEPRVNEIRSQTDERLKQVLTADQWKKFQQARNDMRQRRARGGPNGP